MKKLFLPVMLCAALLSGQQAKADANIYASGLKVDGNNVQFVLNAPGTVVVNFYEEGSTTPAFSQTATYAEKGTKTLAIQVPDDVAIDLVGKTLSWEVVATGATINETYTGFSAKSSGSSEIPETQKMDYPCGIAVDKNPQSPYFGNIYVLNSDNALRSGSRELGNGVYIYNTALELQNPGENGVTPYDGGVNWTGEIYEKHDHAPNIPFSPASITVGDDGLVYISDMSESNGGVYVMDPADPTADFKKVLTPQTDDHYGVCGVCVVGTGADKVLYTINMSQNVAENGLSGYLYKYPIGDLTEYPYTGTGEKVLAVGAHTMGGKRNIYLASDRRGGVWVTQRWTNSTYRGLFTLVHVTKNGVVSTFGSDANNYFDDWFSYYNGVSTRAMGIDTNSDGSKVAIGVYGAVGVQDVTYNEDGTVATIANSSNYIKGYTKGAGAGTYVNNNSTINHLVMGVAFDVADNIYVADWSDYFQAYALAKADNTYTTKANNGVLISLEMTGVEGVAVDADAPVEYYNLQGVKVANPENGIFVKKQGSRITKVVR